MVLLFFCLIINRVTKKQEGSNALPQTRYRILITHAHCAIGQLWLCPVAHLNRKDKLSFTPWWLQAIKNAFSDNKSANIIHSKNFLMPKVTPTPDLIF